MFPGKPLVFDVSNIFGNCLHQRLYAMFVTRLRVSQSSSARYLY